MLHLATDTSFDPPICACGYVLTKAVGGSKRLVETGSRVFNVERDDRDIDWQATRGEYRALISGVRVALDYEDHAILCHTDSDGVVEAINHPHLDDFEPYFRHALMSFLGRFDHWRVRVIDRNRNVPAHQQARTALQTAREYLDTEAMEAP